MPARYRDVQIEPSGASVGIHFLLENQSGAPWKPDAFSIGWQFFDPLTDRFIMEGQWTPLPAETKPGESAEVRLTIPFPPEPGAYRVYVSPIEQTAGWAYGRGDAFLAVDVAVTNAQAEVVGHELTTTRALRLRNL